jgi:peptide/nickel transport system permease protein
MLNEGRTYLETAPWMSIFPGIAIMLAVLGFNLLGDGLREALDPQLRGRQHSRETGVVIPVPSRS